MFKNLVRFHCSWNKIMDEVNPFFKNMNSFLRDIKFNCLEVLLQIMILIMLQIKLKEIKLTNKSLKIFMININKDIKGLLKSISYINKMTEYYGNQRTR